MITLTTLDSACYTQHLWLPVLLALICDGTHCCVKVWQSVYAIYVSAFLSQTVPACLLLTRLLTCWLCV